jgi:hypothetical protein
LEEVFIIEHNNVGGEDPPESVKNKFDVGVRGEEVLVLQKDCAYGFDSKIKRDRGVKCFDICTEENGARGETLIFKFKNNIT